MPLSKEKQLEYMRKLREQKKDSVIPNVIPKPPEDPMVSVIPKHCHLKHCVICDPAYYQELFKKTYGDYDWPNMSDDLKVKLSQT